MAFQAQTHELTATFGQPEPRYPIQAAEIAWARGELRKGRDLGDVADQLGLMARELDAALWAWLGSAIPGPIEEPGFEHVSRPLGRVLARIAQREPAQ